MLIYHSLRINRVLPYDRFTMLSAMQTHWYEGQQAQVEAVQSTTALYKTF